MRDMAAAMLGVMGAALGRMQVLIDRHHPLTRTDPDTGRTVDVPCTRINGALVFHPDRLAMVLAEINWRTSSHLARWADDGGREP